VATQTSTGMTYPVPYLVCVVILAFTSTVLGGGGGIFSFLSRFLQGSDSFANITVAQVPGSPIDH
jgi:hypothetical protein